MATTQAQQAQMESTATHFDQADQQLRSMLKNLLNELEGLRTQWQGAGGRSFEAVKQAWAADQEVLHKNLTETASGIRTAGKNYTVTDTASSEQLGRISTGGNINLPLT